MALREHFAWSKAGILGVWQCNFIELGQFLHVSDQTLVRGIKIAYAQQLLSVRIAYFVKKSRIIRRKNLLYGTSFPGKPLKMLIFSQI